MSIEELENELKELKACAYDINGEYLKLTQKIDALTLEIKSIKEKEDVQEKPISEVQENIEIPVVDDNVQIEDIQQDIVVIPEVSQADVILETPTEAQAVSVNDETVTPIVSNEEIEPQGDVVPGPQVLNQEPLTPVGLEISNSNADVVYTKIDSNEPKAIMINALQSEKLRNSKVSNEAILFGNDSDPVVEQSLELPKFDNVVVDVPVVKTPEQEINEMMDQAQQLYAEGKTKEAEELTSKILSKNVNEAA